MKKALTVIGAVLGVAALAAIPFIVGVDTTFQAIRRVGWAGLLAFVGNASLVLLAPGTGWWIIMRGEGIKASLVQTLRAVLMGFPVNMLTPSAQLGAEPLKTVYLARVTGAPKRQVLATIIVSKLQEIVGLVAAALVAVALLAWRAEIAQSQRLWMGIAVGAAALAVAIAMTAFCLNAQPTVKLINAVACLGFARRRLARLRHHAREMETMIHACFVHRPGRFLVAQAITLVSAASNFLRPWLYLHVIGIPVGAEHLAGIFLVTNGINLIAFTPGSVGLFEGGVLGYFAAAGLGKEVGAAYAMVNRVADVTLIVLGGWLIVQAGLMRVARGKEESSQSPVNRTE